MAYKESQLDNSSALFSVSFAPSLAKIFETDAEKIVRLENENAQLREDISLERKLRYDSERKIEELNDEIFALKSQPQKRKRRTKQEMEALRQEEYSEYKSDGKRKSRPAEPIRSYEDFHAMQEYFGNKTVFATGCYGQ